MGVSTPKARLVNGSAAAVATATTTWTASAPSSAHRTERGALSCRKNSPPMPMSRAAASHRHANAHPGR